MTKRTKQQLLDQIAADIVAHKVCPDLARTATHLVFGEGSPDADIMFIGEAPGKTEDQTGRPFVGAAGKFLAEMLESIGSSRDDVYITSILKYRPPNNRDPLPAEKTEFMPYLQAQLEVIQPKLIVTLGRHSTNCFLPDLQISKVHGVPQTVRLPGRVGRPGASAMQGAGEQQSESTWVILPLYHPAAALYNGDMRQIIIDDFSKIPKVLKQIK